MDFPGGSMVKNMSAKKEMQVQFLGWEDPLEDEMEIHSSIFVWKIPQTEKPGGLYSPWGHKRVGHNLATKTTLLRNLRENISRNRSNYLQLFSGEVIIETKEWLLKRLLPFYKHFNTI